MHAFLDALFPSRETERMVERASVDDVLVHLAPLSFVSNNQEITALLPYRVPLVSALILEAKYHGNRRAYDLLGKVLAEYLAEFAAEEDAFEERSFALVPIPLSEKRFGERGYNQAERIATCAIAALGLTGTPSIGALVRVRDTESQTHLRKEERLKNVQRAFLAGHVRNDLAYILIDDVVTTGATLLEGARALREAGVLRIVCVALSH